MNKFLLLCASLSFLLNGAVTMANTANIQENINIDSKSKCISLDIKEVVARHGKQCRNTAVYFNIKNTSDEDIVITGAHAHDIAETVEVHNIIKNKEVVEMKKLDKLLVPKGATVIFKPRSLHIMLMNLKKDLILDETFKMILNTDKGDQELTVTIKKPNQINNKE